MSAPLRVAVLGATGRMGRMVLAEVLDAADLALVAAVARGSHGVDAAALVGRPACGVRVGPTGPGCFGDAEVIIDFSLPEGLAAAVPHVGCALVSGTTGLTEPKLLDPVAEVVPVLHTTNFSTGVALLLHLAAEAARALPDYDVEIVETHHRLKQDSPSGTALSLGQAVAGAREVALSGVSRHGREGRVGVRPVGEIGFHAVRGGDVVGDHDVWLLGPGERIRLGHVATSRATFAAGAVRAARWICGRPAGRYAMAQVLGL